MGQLILSPFVPRERFDALAAEMAEGRTDWRAGFNEGLDDMRGAARYEAWSLAGRLPRTALLDLVRAYLHAGIGLVATVRLWPAVLAMTDGDLTALFADLFIASAERDL